MVIMLSKLRSLAILGGSLLLITGVFQNCDGSGRQTAPVNSSDKLYGNGGGYTGKVTTYAHRSENPTCASTNGIDAIIQITPDSKAFLTRKDCHDQAPEELQFSTLQLMSHNIANLVYNDSVFDDEDQAGTGITSLLCRGTSAGSGARTIQVVDALIKKSVKSGIVEYRGRVIVGVYDSANRLIKTYDLGEVGVRAPRVTGDLEYYSSMTAGMDQRFALTLNTSTMVGMLHYNGNVPATAGSVPSPDSENFIVHGLKCYRQ
jgi:hypothetical protein